MSIIEFKVCKKCNRKLPLTEEYFFKNRQLKGGLEHSCKECRGSNFVKPKLKVSVKQGNKFCYSCNTEFPANTDYFHSNKNYKDGLNFYCKECSNKTKKQSYDSEKKSKYYKQHKKCISDRNKIYYKNNKEKISQRNKIYYLMNQEKKIEYGKKYRVKNSDAIMIKRMIYYYKNKDTISKKSKDYREKNKERFAESNKNWRNKNIEHLKKYHFNYRNSEHGKTLRKISENKRRTLKKILPSTLTKQQWDECKNHFTNNEGVVCCAYCGKHIKKVSLEHFIPLAKGGELSKDNVLPVCQRCNASKNDSSFFEWYPKQSFYSNKREKYLLEYLGYKNGIQQLSIL